MIRHVTYALAACSLVFLASCASSPTTLFHKHRFASGYVDTISNSPVPPNRPVFHQVPISFVQLSELRDLLKRQQWKSGWGQPATGLPVATIVLENGKKFVLRSGRDRQLIIDTPQGASRATLSLADENRLSEILFSIRGVSLPKFDGRAFAN